MCFKEILSRENSNAQEKAARLEWRLSCFDTGLKYAHYIQDQHFGIRGKRVLDVACAWGGHAVAFAQRGCRVFASDLNNHAFSSLARFSEEHTLPLHILQADCKDLPFPDQAFDIILALELVEHIGPVEPFAREVARLLRPGGICVISTPARFRSFFEGEPHYGVKGLTLLPFSWQHLVATKILGRSYSFPITSQFPTASSVIHPFREQGLSGIAVIIGRLAERLNNWPGVLRWARELVWSFIIIQKPLRAGAPFEEVNTEQ